MSNIGKSQHIALILPIVLIAIALTGSARAQLGAGAIVAVDEGSGAAAKSRESSGGTSGQKGYGQQSGSAPKKGTKSGGSKVKLKTNPAAAPVTEVRARPAGPFAGPVIGDKYSFLNFEVAVRVPPVHTNKAKAVGAKGLVQVEILVDQDGYVLTAKARTGNKILWDEAERAALSTRLNRPSVNGQPARALGFLVYRFGPAEDDDDY